MSKDLHNIDNLFQNKIEVYDEMPNDKIWQNIDQHLDKKATVYFQKRYTNLKRIAAILLILFVASVIYINNNKTPNVAQKEQQNLKNTNTNKINADEKIINSTKNGTAKKIENLQNKNPHLSKKEIQIANKNSSTINYENGFSEIDNITKKIVVKNIYKNSTKRNKLYNNNEVNKIEKLTNKENVINNTILNNNNLDIVERNDISKIDVKLSNAKHLIAKPQLSQSVNIANLFKSIALKKPKLNARKKLAITLFATPELAYNRIENEEEHKRPPNNNTPPGTPGPTPRFEDRHKIKEDELQIKSFTTGVNTQFNITKNLVLQTGLMYNSQSSYTKEKKVFAERDEHGDVKFKNNCSFGTTFIKPKDGTVIQIGDSAIAAPTFSKLQYIGIPFQVGYAFTKNKFTIQPTVGVTYNFLVNKQSQSSLVSTNVKEMSSIQGVNNSFINANFAIQLQHKLNKNISIVLSPISKVAISSINKNNNTKSYPNTFGLITGLQFYF